MKQKNVIIGNQYRVKSTSIMAMHGFYIGDIVTVVRIDWTRDNGKHVYRLERVSDKLHGYAVAKRISKIRKEGVL